MPLTVFDLPRFVDMVTTRTIWRPWWYFAVLAVVLATDLVALGWRRSSIGRLVAWERSARADFFIALAHWSSWSQVLMTIFSGGLVWSLQRWITPREAPITLEYLPGWGQVAVVFLVTDFLHYWYHRISHEVAFLWEAHKYHHAATEFTILTGNRIHALEEIFKHVTVAIPLAFLGASPGMYVAIRAVMLGFDMLQHSMVPWTYGWFGRWVVFSPVGHRIHHSREEEHWDCNYGDLLVIWDRIFGTWYVGGHVNDVVDVSDNQYNRRGVLAEYLGCGLAYIGAFVRSFRTGRWLTDHQRSRRAAR